MKGKREKERDNKKMERGKIRSLEQSNGSEIEGKNKKKRMLKEKKKRGFTKRKIFLIQKQSCKAAFKYQCITTDVTQKKDRYTR